MRKRSRRRFLGEVAAAVGGAALAPYVVPASARGADGAVPPSERVTMASLGVGPRGTDVLGHFLRQPDVQWIAVSDCRAERLIAAKAVVDRHYATTTCATYPDFREMLTRDDLDGVLIATGNRWHALGSIYAAKAGKDVYSEKPISLYVAEGRALVETCRRYGTAYQAGFQRHSVDSYRFQVEAVRKQLIGRLHTILCQVWTSPTAPPEAPKAVPKGFDYDMWLGQTPYHPYTETRVRMWPYFWDTGDGVLSDMGCHYTDIAQWGHDSEASGPVEFEGEAQWAPDSFTEVPVSGEVRCTYADGVKLVLRSRGGFTDRFIRFIGDEGWIQIDDHTNEVTAEPKSILKWRGISGRGWGDPGDHVRNLLTAIKTRGRTVCHPELAHRAMSICQLACLCLRLGRRLRWDPQAERFLGDPEADRMLYRTPRPPWRL